MRLQRRPVPVSGKSLTKPWRAARRANYAIEPLEQRLLLSASTYVWQNAQIEGGGFVDGIFYSPTQQNVIYARTDIGGLYKSTNDGQNWQQLLDFVGNNTADSGNGTQSQEIGVLSFAIDPENANNLYALVGEYTGTDGDVLYSTNGGATWSQTALSFYVGGNENGRGMGERIAVDPNDSNIVFLGSNANGLWESTNAGHSFSQVTSFPSAAASSGISFVLFNPAGSHGHASQTIYVGSSSTAAGTNLYVTTNGGSSWSEITGTGSPTTGFMPDRAALTSNGYLYLTYTNDLPPSGNITNGAVMSYDTGTGVWTNISPVIPGAGGDDFGYVGLALDPENSTTIVVTTFDNYGGTDQIYRTTNADTATPTWTALYDNASADGGGYFGYDDTRNTANAPWVAAFGDGIGNWAATVAINPFNSAQIMYGTGQGIWATNDGTSTTMLTAANSWYFPDQGIEFTAVNDLVAPPAGVPLFSAIGDIEGFAHTTLTSSPAAGGIDSANFADDGAATATSVDFAEQDPDFEAIVGAAPYGSPAISAFTTNDGATWTQFASTPISGAQEGSIAVAANASTIVWAPSGSMPYYTTNNGATWTASIMPSGAAAGGTLVADRVNPNYIYYWTENSSDNSWTLYVSDDGGQGFSESAQGPMGIGNVTLVADPFVAGELWLSSYIGIYQSTDFGQSFTQNSVIGYADVPSIALGAPAPGSSQAAIYIYGTIGSFTGVYRSDDGGATWTQLNSVSEQWGGNITTMAADPNVFGRVYVGVNGRGILIGDPASSLPTNWTDTDINTPGNPGWVTDSTTLSNGTTVSQWIIDGGGAGIQGTSDQFNFAYEPESGSATIIATLLSLTDADGTSSTPQAGVMIRGGDDSNDPFAAIVENPNDTITFEYRASSGGGISTVATASVAIESEYLQLTRNGDSFTASYSFNGINWTQLGSTITIAAMPNEIDVGLAATAVDNEQLTSATFDNVQVNPGPTVVQAAAASPNPTPTSSTVLSVLGSANGSESGLTYFWSGSGPGSITYSGTANGSTAASTIDATFSATGSYTMTATITSPDGLTATSSVVVDNSPVPTKLGIVSQPTVTANGVTLVSPIQVGVESAGGVVISTDTSTVTIHMLSGPAHGTLTGTTSVAAVNGVAVFSNLTLTGDGNYVLEATDGSLTSTTTSAILVVTVPVRTFTFNGVPISRQGLIFEIDRDLGVFDPPAGVSVSKPATQAAPVGDMVSYAFAAAPPVNAAATQPQSPFNSGNDLGVDGTLLSDN